MVQYQGLSGYVPSQYSYVFVVQCVQIKYLDVVMLHI